MSYFVGAFGAISNVFCGTGIAMLRLLYVKHPMAVQRLELKIANFLLSGCVGLAFLGSYLHYISPKRNTTTDDICMGTPRDLELVLYDYQSQNEFPTTIYGLFAVLFLFIVTEFWIYVDICVYLFKHNLTMKNILSNQIIRKRNSRNAMDLIGHMFSFALDNLLLVFVSLNLHTGQYKLANILATSAALSKWNMPDFLIQEIAS